MITETKDANQNLPKSSSDKLEFAPRDVTALSEKQIRNFREAIKTNGQDIDVLLESWDVD